MNHFAYYALKCEGGDFVSCDSVEGCSFAGGNAFTFSMDFHWSGQVGILFRQEGSVCCQIRDDELHWKSTNWEIATNSLTTPLIADRWNHIDVVYEEKRVLLYLNGIQTAETALSKQAQSGSTQYCFLEDYTGYLRNVRIVDHSMTQEEIADNLLQTKLELEHIWLWLPFDAPYAQDRGKYQKKVSYPGLCRCESLVTALRFSGDGYALLDRVTQNPGSAQFEDFSVAMRFYSIPCAIDSALLFENSGDLDGFQICLEEKQSKLVLTWGKERKILDTPTIPYYEWTDLVVSVGQSEIHVFLNGITVGSIVLSSAYSRNSKPHLCLGERFTGYIDYFALYNQELTLEAASQIHAMEPYVFDTGISLLYLFHGEPKQNFLGSGTLLLQEGAKIEIAEGTVYDETIEPINFRGRSTFSGNDFEKWQADILADISGQFAVTATGHGICALDLGTIEFLWDRVGNCSAAQDIFLDYEVFTAEKILPLMGAIISQGVCLSVLTSMLSKGGSLGFLAIYMDDLMAYQLAAETALSLGFLLEVAIISKKKSKKPEKPPVPIPPPQPKTGYTIELLSIQFCNGKEGSLPLREDYQKKQHIPEWSSSSTDEAVCAYVARKQSPKLKLSFRYTPAKNQPPVSIRLGFRSNLLGICLSNEKTCMVDDVYEVEATCDKNQLEKARMGRVVETLRCYSQDAGKERMLRTVDVKIHILCRTPCVPWSTDNHERAPVIPLLNIASEIADAAKNKIEDEKSYLDAVSDWLGGRTDFALQSAEKYSSHNIGNALFCAEKFVENLQKNGFTAGMRDYYLFTSYIGTMEGLTVYVYELSGMERGRRSRNGSMQIQSMGVCMDTACRIFGNVCPEEFCKCYLISAKKTKDAVYWDLLTRRADMPSGWRKVAWENYRDQVISWSSFVYDPIPLEGWIEAGELPKQPFTITFDSDVGIFVCDGRWDFKPYVKDRFRYPKNKACCHRVSYHTIEQILLSTFNSFAGKEITNEQKNEVLNLLQNGFYPNGAPQKDFFPDEYQNYTELIQNLDRLKQITVIDWNNAPKVGKHIDAVLNCLNSATGNLRDGYASWNSSIGESFDPASWFAVLNIDDRNYKVISQDGICDPEEMSDLIQGVYLNDVRDGQLLYMLKKLEEMLGQDFIDFDYPTYSHWDGTQSVRYPAVRSSCNEFDLYHLRNEVIVIPYYYMNPQEGWIEL